MSSLIPGVSDRQGEESHRGNWKGGRAGRELDSEEAIRKVCLVCYKHDPAVTHVGDYYPF
jgi:hypothetical protein